MSRSTRSAAGFPIPHHPQGRERECAGLQVAGIPLDGASDHGVSEALYLRDPDANGVELYWDRPEAAWPRNAAGELAMNNAPLDLNALLAAASADTR